jgi:hypothetical protein
MRVGDDPLGIDATQICKRGVDGSGQSAAAGSEVLGWLRRYVSPQREALRLAKEAVNQQGRGNAHPEAVTSCGRPGESGNEQRGESPAENLGGDPHAS